VKTTNTYKTLRVYYIIYNMPPTCFSDTCGHPQTGELQRVQYITKRFEPTQNVSYLVLKCVI